MVEELPEVRFDTEMGVPIFPRPLLKHAALVPIPKTEDGSEIPTFIWPEWGGVQVFYGSYYAIIDGGLVIYGSAKEQWEAMHTAVRDGYWVKTAIPTAYTATERCRIVTLIPSDDGGIRETNHVVEPGDLIVRQPGGEVQKILATNFARLYFTPAEVSKLGLNKLSAEDFAAWAVANVLEPTSSA